MLHKHTTQTNARGIIVNLKIAGTIKKNQYRGRSQLTLEFEKAFVIVEVLIENNTPLCEVSQRDNNAKKVFNETRIVSCQTQKAIDLSNIDQLTLINHSLNF